MSTQSYVKQLKIDIDTTELEHLKKELDKLHVETLEVASKELLSLDEVDPENAERIQELRDAIEALTNDLEEVEPDSLFKDFKSKMKELGEDIADELIGFLKDIFSDAIKRMNEMATFDFANSLMFNRSAFEQSMQYGIMDPSQNYALSQAMSFHGLSNEEDMMYWLSNPRNRDIFAETIGRYTSQYNKLANKDFFRNIQEFQLEWKKFKEELAFSLIEFFMNNKDLIKSVMTKGIVFMEKTLVLLGKLMDFFSRGRSDFEKESAASDIINSYMTTSSKNTNVNINNTMYPSSQVLSDKSMLEHAGELSYAQLINVLEGD